MEQYDVPSLIRQAWEVRQANFENVIYFDYPTQTESITLTGRSCALNCAHCGGHYLKGMRSIEEIQIQGALNERYPFRSALVSGGCTPEGKVPFLEHLEFLRDLKRDIRLNFHVGLLDNGEIPFLKNLADVVSFDFVADRETIREVYGLERGPEDYRRVFLALREILPVMPHLTLGLKGGEWSGEAAALEALDDMKAEGIVFNVFIPTPGTKYADRQPLPVEEVVRFLASARIRFPKIPLFLGCMRPKGRYRQSLDEAAVALGLNHLVMPTPGARRKAEELRLKIVRGEECCAL